MVTGMTMVTGVNAVGVASEKVVACLTWVTWVTRVKGLTWEMLAHSKVAKEFVAAHVNRWCVICMSDSVLAAALKSSRGQLSHASCTHYQPCQLILTHSKIPSQIQLVWNANIIMIKYPSAISLSLHATIIINIANIIGADVHKGPKRPLAAKTLVWWNIILLL